MKHPKPSPAADVVDLSALATYMADQLAHTDIEAECDVVVSNGQEWIDLDSAGSRDRHPEDRAYTRSMAMRADRYLRARGDLTSSYRVIRNPAFPMLLRLENIERTCRGCGCTDSNACADHCWWIEADLCSSCVAAAS